MDTVATSQPRISTAAVWSLVLGILSMFCLWLLGSIPAIILGVLALNKINAQPTAVRGREIAISGIVTGAVGILSGLFALAVIASIAMPAYNVSQANAVRAVQTQEIRNLTMACFAYAKEHDQKFPKNLRELYPTYVDEESAFIATGTEERQYLYRSAATEPRANEPLILLPTEAGERHIIGYADGSVAQAIDPLPPEILREFQ